MSTRSTRSERPPSRPAKPTKLVKPVKPRAQARQAAGFRSLGADAQELQGVVSRLRSAWARPNTTTPTSGAKPPDAPSSTVQPAQGDLSDLGERSERSEIRDACPRCHDTGWLRSYERPGDLLPTVVRCACQAHADAQRRADRARLASDAAPDRALCDFAAYDATYNRRALSLTEAWATGYAGPGCRIPGWSPWLTLYGGYGSGKTHLLGAAFHALLDAGYAPIYTVAPLLLDHIRDGIEEGDYSQRFYAVRDCPILLLDDLGAESHTPWSEEALFKLIDYRYRLRLPLAVASNLSPDDLEPRIGSRLRDHRLAQVERMRGPDWRVR